MGSTEERIRANWSLQNDSTSVTRPMSQLSRAHFLQFEVYKYRVSSSVWQKRLSREAGDDMPEKMRWNKTASRGCSHTDKI